MESSWQLKRCCNSYTLKSAAGAAFSGTGIIANQNLSCCIIYAISAAGAAFSGIINYRAVTAQNLWQHSCTPSYQHMGQLLQGYLTSCHSLEAETIFVGSYQQLWQPFHVPGIGIFQAVTAQNLREYLHPHISCWASLFSYIDQL